MTRFFAARAVPCLAALAVMALGIATEIFAPAAAAAQATAPAPAGTHRIALVSDPHVSTRPTEANYVRHFQRVIDEVNAADVEAVVLTGDLTQDGGPSQMEEFKRLAKGFKAKVFCVAGNHDVGQKIMPGLKGSLGPKRLKNFEDHIGPLFFADELVPGYRVVGICSSLIGSGLPEEQAQWAFLEKQLADKQGGEPIVFSHYPPYVSKPDEADEYFNMNGEQRARFLDLLRTADVKTMLTGHLHHPVNYVTPGGTQVIGAPAVSFGLPKGKQPEGWVLVKIGADKRCTFELKYIPADPPATAPATKPDTLLIDR